MQSHSKSAVIAGRCNKMTIQLLAKITEQEQQSAIEYAKNKPQSCNEMAEGELAVFELSQTWHKSEEWVKRFLSTTFLIMLTVLGGFNTQPYADHERVRTTKSRRRD